ncbi:MAG TPA: YeeE/YedE family protein [Gemmatimonadetes bacterium]|nr:YeeE/YedE family protein [Gemmatimonadota bacterium]
MPEVLTQPWPWYVAGPLIGLLVPFVYWYGGKKWGVSSTLQHMCAATVPGRIEYFQYDWWKKGAWQLAMAAGTVLGGFIGGRILSAPDDIVAIAEATRSDLAALGVTDFTGMVPSDVFAFESLLTVPGIVIILLGGFLVGFGARYANGCTSGHAISGLSNLQLSSLLAVVGFFVGGLISAHFLLPILLG